MKNYSKRFRSVYKLIKATVINLDKILVALDRATVKTITEAVIN